MTRECIILVGGLGTRLSRVLGNTPKPLAKVANRPFLYYILDALAVQHFKHIILATSYQSALVEETVGSQYRGMQVSYSVEDTPLGTGGAITQALSLSGSRHVLVLNGDTLIGMYFIYFYQCHLVQQCLVTLALVNVDNTERYGRVRVESGKVAEFIEKGLTGSGLINGGAYWIDRDVFTLQPGAFSFEEQFLKKKIDQLGYFITDCFFIDIGVPEDYYRACSYFSFIVKINPNGIKSTQDHKA